MYKINDLIEFLRLDRRYGEAEAQDTGTGQSQVSALSLLHHEERTIGREEFNNLNIYIRIFDLLDRFSADHFYILPLPGKNVFYIKIGEEGEFLNLETSRSETGINEAALQQISIDYATYDYIYDKNAREVIILKENLREVAVFGDSEFFDPEKIGISSGTYAYNYSKPISTFSQFINGILKLLEFMINPLGAAGNKKKDVEISVKKKGTIYLVPTIYNAGDAYYLCYYYTRIRKKLSYQITEADIALKLKFSGKEPFLSFLNETIFTQKTFGYLASQHEERRAALVDDFKRIIIAPLENQLRSGSVFGYYDAMRTLYYLTDDIALTLSSDGLWTIFEYAVGRNSLTNKLSLEEEAIFIKLLEAIAANEKAKKNFLIRMLQKKDEKTTYLQFLFERIQGENGLAFCNLVNKAWKKSRFTNPDPEENKEFKNTDGPLLLPYESEKWLGFYFSNASVSFNKQDSLSVAFDTGQKELKIVRSKDDSGIAVDDVRMESIIAHYIYHPFYPVFLKNIEEQETEVKLDTIVPAFMLLANADQQFGHNVVKTGEYALDAVTTLSGVGNIAKFRHLAKLGKAKSAIATVRLAAGTVEITSGAANTLLKLTGLEDTKGGSALRDYLFWLELLSLSGEITIAIKNGLKKSAKEVLEHEDELYISAKNADETSQIDDVIEELEEVAGLDLMAKPQRIGNLGGKVLRTSQIRKLRRQLKEKGILLILEEDIKLSKLGKIKNKEVIKAFEPVYLGGVKFDKLNDLFYTMRNEGLAGAYDARTRQFFLTENPTEYLVFHEMSHVKHFEELGEAYHKLPAWEKETYVFKEIWKQKHLHTKEELEHALEYVNSVREKARQKLIKL
ncbi:MAG TPA: zincin-like metallopeptidase toxin domain-containing protein [Flavobacterium sp.]|nr:zincin-like metallopeptidase toxin domain-containing protein [Flavobacterium sp.]